MIKPGLFGGDYDAYNDIAQRAVENAFLNSPDPDNFGMADVAAAVANPALVGPGPMDYVQSELSRFPPPTLLAFQPQAAPSSTPGSNLTGFDGAHDAPVEIQSPAPPAGNGNAESPQNAPGLGPVIGYPETGSGAYRSGNDEVIRKAVTDFNSRNGYKEGDPGYISPELMKSWEMQESGGFKDRSAFESDPFQVNSNPLDWDDKKATLLGLSKGQVMTPEASAKAALKWLQYKSWIHDNSGNPVTYKGVRQGFDSYNGGGVENYGSNILNRYYLSWGGF
jgi:hypothetical protein